MKTTYTRFKREFALVLIVAMIISMVGCKKKKAGNETDPVSIPSSDMTETTPDESTTETTEETTTTESTAAPETSETTPSEVTESTEPSETTLDPTATPTDVPVDPTATSTPKPTKAPKETKKDTPTATPTTPPTNTPTSTSTPTPVPTDTPTPTPSTAPAKTKDAKDYMGTARSAIKQAISDKCSWKTGFEFNNNMMENEKARAKYSVNNDYFGHGEISGTVCTLEACGGVGCTYLPDTDQLEWYWTDHSGTNHYYKDDAYSCFYDFAVFLVVDHTEKLAGDDKHIYFGYGAAIKYTPWERSYGLGTVEEWSISVYIGAHDEIMYAIDFPEG